MLDVTTMFWIVSVISITLGLCMLVASSSEETSSLRDFSFANICHGLGYFSFLMSKPYGSKFIWLGETLISISISTWMLGILQFLNARKYPAVRYLIIFAVSVVSFFFTERRDVRIVFNSSCYVVVELILMIIICAEWRKVYGLGKYLVAFSIAMNISILSYRVFFTLINRQSVRFINATDISQSILYTSVLISLTCLSIGFVLMLKEKTDWLNKESILRDGLTGLWNRRKLNETAKHEMERLRLYGTPVGLAIIDVDNFKSVNDIYGHNVGDQVLLDVSKACLSQLRETDLIGRWGGEEFLVILPNTGLSMLNDIAHRLCQTVNHEVLLPQRAISVSIGLAQCLSTDTWESWIERADKALYAAKHSGKNQVHFDVGIFFNKNVPLINWSKEIFLSNNNINNEHERIIFLINKWSLLSSGDYSKSELLELIDDIYNEMVNHFTNEENEISKEAFFTIRNEHSIKHRKLIDRMTYLVGLFEKGALEIDAITQFFIYELCIEHIQSQDVKLFREMVSSQNMHS